MFCDTILFDLDGTLLNTLEDLADSTNAVLAKHGFPCRTMEEVCSFVGNGIPKLLERAIPEGRKNPVYEACTAEFLEHYSANLNNKTAPYKGILPVLQELSSRGYKLGIVSNKADSAVKQLNTLYFSKLISTAVGASETTAKKPAPDTIYQALKELLSPPESLVYVGDSEVDIQTAKNASVPCISVSWGFRTKEQLLSYGAGRIAETPEELLLIFQNPSLPIQ